jgi:hypothetical protein
MSKVSRVVQQLQDFFTQNPLLELWLLEFGLTHQRGRLRILRGGVTNWIEVIFDGCTYICGSPVGGPNLLRVVFTPGDTTYDDEIMIHSIDEQFIIKCNRIAIDKVYGEYCERFFE